MDNLDILAPNYHRAVQRWSDAQTLGNAYDALKVCFLDRAHGLVEHVKSFIESVCLTILSEFDQPKPSNPNLTALLVKTLGVLGLKNRKGADQLDKVLSGFNKLSDSLTAMRNANGPVAHGKDAFLDPITVDHARAFFHVGDAILGVLLNALDGKEPNLKVTREPYENFQHHNERIDQAVYMNAKIDDEDEQPVIEFSVSTGSHVEVIELRLEPSQLLFGFDRQAYVEVLETINEVSMEPREETKEEVAVSRPDDMPSVAPMEAVGPVTAVISEYGGRFDVLRSGLKALLVSEGITPAAKSAEKDQLIDSLLATVDQNMALDWEKREPIRARLKVACKRVLVRFGTEPNKADELAKRMVGWLSLQKTNEDGTISNGTP